MRNALVAIILGLAIVPVSAGQDETPTLRMDGRPVVAPPPQQSDAAPGGIVSVRLAAYVAAPAKYNEQVLAIRGVDVTGIGAVEIAGAAMSTFDLYDPRTDTSVGSRSRVAFLAATPDLVRAARAMEGRGYRANLYGQAHATTVMGLDYIFTVARIEWVDSAGKIVRSAQSF